MQKGTIKKVMDKGFGFIGVEGQSKDLSEQRVKGA